MVQVRIPIIAGMPVIGVNINLFARLSDTEVMQSLCDMMRTQVHDISAIG